MSEMPSMPMNTTTVTTSARQSPTPTFGASRANSTGFLPSWNPRTRTPLRPRSCRRFGGRSVPGRLRLGRCSNQVQLYPAEDAALRAALMGADVTTPTELGWLLHRLQGRVIGGLLVQRVDSIARDGRLWRTVRSSSPELREP